MGLDINDITLVTVINTNQYRLRHSSAHDDIMNGGSLSNDHWSERPIRI